MAKTHSLTLCSRHAPPKQSSQTNAAKAASCCVRAYLGWAFQPGGHDQPMDRRADPHMGCRSLYSDTAPGHCALRRPSLWPRHPCPWRASRQRFQGNPVHEMRDLEHHSIRRAGDHGHRRPLHRTQARRAWEQQGHSRGCAVSAKIRFPLRSRRSAPMSRGPCPDPTCQGLCWTDVGLCSKSGGKADVPRGRICSTPVIENSEPNFREGVESRHSKALTAGSKKLYLGCLIEVSFPSVGTDPELSSGFGARRP